MKRYLRRPSYGSVMATIAVFVALGGVSYAAHDGSGPANKTWNGSTYQVTKTIRANSPFAGLLTSGEVFCDVGDRALGGGFFRLDPSVGTITASIPTKVASTDSSRVQQGWSISYVNAKPSIPSGVVVVVRCANFH
jgi:hypothetical protein